MLKLTTEYHTSQLLDFSCDDFVFLSSNKSLHAQGCFTKITTPASHHGDIDNPLRDHLSQLFHQAEQAGIKNPIAVGAIPFDKRQPSALYIPYEYHWLERETLRFSAPSSSPMLPLHKCHSWPEKAEFCQMVSQAVDAIHQGQIDKVVLSRLLDIEFEQEPDTIQLFMQLNAQNPYSYNFHLPLGNSTLIGASPELILRKQGNAITSQPLAGSSRRSRNIAEDNALRQSLLHSAKDHHEHQLVINAIRSALTEHCTELMIPDSPSIFSTPLLWHLATEIRSELRNKHADALSVACLLHPTPALCGAPRERAYELIAQLEPFERNYFGGIVGWCDARGNGEWVIAIRCGELFANHVRLFAGAGIVADSQPNAEWQETGVKLGTMLQALGLSANKEHVL
ncbi:isochorismate synthase [Xenorhabdus hominickii]|uniref:isochorismate synthase n=1 Tax=Xenorhabdus hominickii TaxID=351679 RepID=A0A2G0QDI3_XENHO|nr:isochorismate synthase [Xenorhabdus hominickii]AOM41386.1 isochorismate synthase [Xenorhabdus hominickii]PHM55340.1 isochorismate hydroxymutase 2, chrysobactin biosynthesis [Xenorhabdus hominickii]PHM57295.1 isochorismate hydroxymutase 2, chrysobactin biosynthesis [Xenorhabdus hominickii]